MAEEKRLTFGHALDRGVMALIAALLGWLCLSTMTLKEQMASIIARMEARDEMIKRLEVRFDDHVKEDKECYPNTSRKKN